MVDQNKDYEKAQGFGRPPNVKTLHSQSKVPFISKKVNKGALMEKSSERTAPSNERE